jgi:hypothetical protein
MEDTPSLFSQPNINTGFVQNITEKPIEAQIQSKISSSLNIFG